MDEAIPPRTKAARDQARSLPGLQQASPDGSPPFPELALGVSPTRNLSPAHERKVLALFERSYREADLEYLHESMHRLRNVALAFRGDELVGFALSENRLLDLPRLPGQVVFLAGLACVAPELRRRGLLLELSRLGFTTGSAAPPGLSCGRMAHPASFRRMRGNPSVVPRPGVRPTPWQQEVGQAIADAYGVRRFQPDTFVCSGRGRPIGYPVIEIEATPEEWELFRAVDRDRGESLLGIAWAADRPPGW